MHKPRIEDLFQIKSRFLRSANILRDFSDPTALVGYIATEQAKQSAKRLASGLAHNSGQRAWRITGDYGVGKSSFALLIAHLFSGRDSALPPQLRSVVDFNKKARPNLLPVLVIGDREPLGVSVLRAVQRALSSAASKSARSKQFTAINELIEQKKETEITTDLAVALISQANEHVIASGLGSGLLILVDEMGKFLEFAASRQDTQDVYFLQQLAETACRSGNAPLFLVGLLHFGFTAYADRLTHKAQREWEKVAGRFEELLFNHPLDQIALLISEALSIRTELLPKHFSSELRQQMGGALKIGWFGAEASPKTLIDSAPKIFPLHPTVLPVLVKAFHRFGQNERSLFSFLLSNEPFGLQAFSQSEFTSDGFFRLHHLYDYIRSTFGHRLAVQSYRSHWNQIDSMVESFATESETDLAVVKTVGLLNLLNTNELLASDEAVVLALAGLNAEARKRVKQSIERLQKGRRILWSRGKAGGYCLWPHTSVDLESSYQDAGRQIGTISRVSNELKECLDVPPIVARRHYVETGNLRHFEVRYCSVAEMPTELKADPAKTDGRILVALCEDAQERQTALNFAVSSMVQQRPEIVIAIPQPLHQLTGLVQEFKKWEWASRNVPELKDDHFAAEEVSRQREAAFRNLQSQVQYFVGLKQFSQRTSLEFFRKTKRIPVSSARDLLSELSSICDELFGDAPKLKNELVNRRFLSGAAAAARMRLIERMFLNPSRALLGMDAKKKPPEMSIYLSFLQAAGIHRQSNGKYMIMEPSVVDACHLLPAFRKIHEMLERTPDSRVKVSDIFAELRFPPLGIRDGITPLLLATFAIVHEQEVAFYERGTFIRHVAGEEFMRLIKSPDVFEIQYCRITGVRADLFERLLEILELAKSDEQKSELLDVVRPLCVFVAQLPAYVHNTKSLSPSAIAVRDAILNAREPGVLVFNDLPTACGFEPFSVRSQVKTKKVHGFVERLKLSLDELKTAHRRLHERIKAVVRHVFDAKGDFEAIRKGLAQRSENILVTVKEPKLKAFCLRLFDEHLPESDWIESLGSLLALKPPSKWNDSEEALFEHELADLAGRFLRVESVVFKQGKRFHNGAGMRVSITNADGTELERVIYFSAQEESQLAKLQTEFGAMLGRDRRIGVAAASRAIWETLEKDK